MTITVGEVRLDRLVERDDVPVGARYQFPDLGEEEAANLVAAADPRTVRDGMLLLSFHSWLVRTAGTVILVDPCVGNGKHRPTLPYLHQLDTPYLANLAALGVSAAQVDIVVSSHQHVDHVGWFTTWDGRSWQPTFPRARHLLSDADFRHFDAAHRAGVVVNHGSHVDSVLPVVDAGLATLLTDEELDGYPVAPGVTLRHAPGHTPGSIVIDVASGGERALLAGDAIHHVIQVGRPELRNHVDADPGVARRTRERLLASCAESGALLLPAHFPASGAGRVRRDADGYHFTFLDSGQEAS